MSTDAEKSRIWGLPEQRTRRRLLEIALIWSALSLAWYIFGQSGGVGDLLGYLILPAILLPFVRLLLHPGSLPETPKERRDLESSTIITYLSTLGITLLITMVLDNPAGGNPASVTTLLIAIPLLYLLSLQQRLLDLQRGTSGLVWTLFRGVFLFFLVTTFLRDSITPEIAFTISFLVVGPPLFFRSLRNEWVVQLDRAAKYRLVGLSLLGIMASIGWLILMDTLIVSSTPDIYSPAEHFLLETAGFTVLVIFSAQCGLFFRALATLPTARMIDRRQQEVTSLSNIGKMMSGAFDREVLLGNFLKTAADVTGSELSWLRLRDRIRSATEREAHRFALKNELIAVIDEIEAVRPGVGGESLVERGEENEEIIFFRLDGLQTLLKETGSESGMVAMIPLVISNDRIGTLSLFTSDARGFDRDDRRILETVAAQISITLEHAELLERSLERERLQSEMEIARDAQQRLLPSRLPDITGVSLHATSLPASMVGGDYYDMVEFRDGTVGMIVADVAGKGAGAALYMSMVKGVVRGLNGRTDGTAEFLGEINKSLYRQIDPRFFVTMTVARLIPERDEIELARAGHTPALFLTFAAEGPPEMSLLSPGGLGLALSGPTLFDATIEPVFRPMRPGDVLALFSDGLTEARGADGEELGEDGCSELIARAVNNGPGTSLSVVSDEIIREISTFSGDAPQHDDITLLLIRWESHMISSNQKPSLEESIQ